MDDTGVEGDVVINRVHDALRDLGTKLRREYYIREFDSISDDGVTDNGPTLAAAIAEADIIANVGHLAFPLTSSGDDDELDRPITAPCLLRH